MTARRLHARTPRYTTEPQEMNLDAYSNRGPPWPDHRLGAGEFSALQGYVHVQAKKASSLLGRGASSARWLPAL
jgi:hypothetical protein